MPPARPGSRTQRRVARTKAAIEDAFVQLVLEQGYDRVAVEDITDRADLARATFYAHFPNKEAVQFSVFNRLTEDLVQRLASQGGPPAMVHRDAISAAYQQAADLPDLYRACLSDARTRQAHLSTLSRYAEQNFRDRLTALGRQPRVPVPVMARAFVGAHVAVLEAWLAGELDGNVEELASMALDLLIYGAAWAHGIRLEELGYSTGSPADARAPSPSATPRSRRPQPASTSTSDKHEATSARQLNHGRLFMTCICADNHDRGVRPREGQDLDLSRNAAPASSRTRNYRCRAGRQHRAPRPEMSLPRPSTGRS